jgi:hypothetical protein
MDEARYAEESDRRQVIRQLVHTYKTATSIFLTLLLAQTDLAMLARFRSGVRIGMPIYQDAAHRVVARSIKVPEEACPEMPSVCNYHPHHYRERAMAQRALEPGSKSLMDRAVETLEKFHRAFSTAKAKMQDVTKWRGFLRLQQHRKSRRSWAGYMKVSGPFDLGIRSGSTPWSTVSQRGGLKSPKTAWRTERHTLPDLDISPDAPGSHESRVYVGETDTEAAHR